MPGCIFAEQGDITRAAVDVIVNAAESSLLGRRAASTGRSIARQDRGCSPNVEHYGGCPTGEARITGAYDLPHRHVIHTVGPIWYGGSVNEAALLASCYRNALRLAVEAVCARWRFRGFRRALMAIRSGGDGHCGADCARFPA